MEIQFVIVRSENAEYLCHNVNGTYVDVSDPSTEFVSGEDDFRLVEQLPNAERIRVSWRTLLSHASILWQWLVSTYFAKCGR